MIMRAMTRGDIDPEGRGRVRVALPGADPMWADRAFPVTPYGDADLPGDVAVWVGFEDDDHSRPVVLGLVEPLPRAAARTLQVEGMGDAWDQGHAAGSTDAVPTDAGQGSGTANPYR